ALQRGDFEGATRHLVAGVEFRGEVANEMTQKVEARKAKGITSASDLTHDSISEGAEGNNDIKGEKDHMLGVSDTIMAGVAKERKELKVDLAGYENYSNPLAGLLTHILLRTHGTGLRQTDRENAKAELDALAVFAPRNSVVNGLDLSGAAPLANTVFVFFETGLAPRQEQRIIYIPIPDFGVAWIPPSWGIAYPELVANPDYVKKLTIQTASQKRVETEVLVDFDAVVQQSFDDAWPGVIARQITQSIIAAALSTSVKAAAYSAVENDGDENGLGTILAEIVIWGATAALDYILLDSDTRSWELLPKEVQVARLDIPQDRALTLSFPNGAWRETLTLGAGDVMAVWVKSTSPWQPAPVATQFRFK
ncbi:MAG: hypothetical protein FWF96_02365, partial [Kiritimatiellaeota bacterium]|nr:hypothetical protein [Kiritimatiellota bacterium]